MLFNFAEGFEGEIKKIKTNWNYSLNNDIGYDLGLDYKEIKYSVFVDTFNNLNLRDILIRTTNKKDHIFNLLIDEDIKKMYYSMIYSFYYLS